MNFGAPTDLYSAYQQQQPAQPQITPWVAQRMQNAQPQQGAPMGAQQPRPGGGMGAQPRQGMQGADPTLLKAIVAMNSENAEAQDAQRSKELAGRLRADAKGQLAGRDTGKFYVGPTWLNFAANVMQNQAAHKADDKAADSEKKSAKRQQETADRIVEALSRQNRETY